MPNTAFLVHESSPVGFPDEAGCVGRALLSPWREYRNARDNLGPFLKKFCLRTPMTQTNRLLTKLLGRSSVFFTWKVYPA
jgi:hypothetical protein